MVALKLYYFALNVLQSPKMIADNELNNRLEKYILLTVSRILSQLQVFLFPVNFEFDGKTSHKHGLAANYSFKIGASKVEFWTFFETNVFMIADT